MGRPEKPVDVEEGPVARFASALRQLREQAGGPTYRRLAERTGYSPTALSQAAAGQRLPSLDVVLAYAVACGADREEWERRWHETREAVREADDDLSCPYPGAAPFDEDEHELFFGREPLVRHVARTARDEGLCLVTGPSGVGLTSLLCAGVAAALRGDTSVQGGVQLVRPGSGSPGDQDKGPTGACAWLVLDDLEQFLDGLPDEGAREEFVGLLKNAREPGGTLRVVAGVRADRVRRWGAELGAAAVPVDRMQRADVRRAVVEPAAARGVLVERALTARLMSDGERTSCELPLLATALRRLWRLRHGRTLTLEAYESFGGLVGLAASTAEEAFVGMPPELAGAARQVLMRLLVTDPAGTVRARAVEWAEFSADARTKAALEHLAARRVVVLGEHTVELAHDGLVRGWPRLAAWATEYRADIEVQRLVTRAAASWRALGRDRGALYRGEQLAAAQRLSLTACAAEREFLDASRDSEAAEHVRIRRANYRLRILAGALVLLLTVVMTVATVAVRERHTAESRQYAVQAQAELASDPAAAQRLAIRAYTTAHTADARGALLGMASSQPFQRRLRPGAGLVKDVDFSPDGRLLAAAGQNGTATVWLSASGRQTAVLGRAGPAARALRFSPDGRLLAIADRSGTVTLWNTSTWHQAGRLEGPEQILDGVAFTPDGTSLAVVGSSDDVTVWDVAERSVRTVLHDCGGARSEVTYSPDGTLLACAGQEGAVVVWDARHPSRSRRLVPQEHHPLYGVAISPDGQTLAAGGPGARVELWNAHDGHHLGTIQGSYTARELAFAPDGILLSADYGGEVIRWDVRRRAAISSLTGQNGAVIAVAVSPDGRTVASAGGDGTVLEWQRDRMPLAGHTGWVTSVDVSADGKFAVSGSVDGSVTLWDTRTRTRRAVLSAHPSDGALAVAFDPGGAWWADTGTDGRVIVRPTAHPTRARVLGHAPTDLTTLAAWRDAVVTGGGDGQVRIWALHPAPGRAAYRKLGTLRASVGTVAAAPDGHTVAAATIDGAVRVWDTRNGGRAWSPPGNACGAATVAISPDSHRLACAGTDGTIHLWDLRTHRPAGDLPTAHAGTVLTLVFSPDGRLLASGGSDRTVTLWDTAGSSRWATLQGHTNTINTARFSSDGTVLYTGSVDRTIIPWTIDPDQAMRTLREEVE